MWRAAPLGLLLAACSADPAAEAPNPADAVTIWEERTVVPSPNGSMSLIFDGGRGLLSAGFLRRSEVGIVEVPSYVLWSPKSDRFYINDSGSASWSRLRVWNIDARAQPVEVQAISQAAASELGRRNGCAHPDETEYMTEGMRWDDDGRRIYVLAEVRREVNCRFAGVEYIVALIDIHTTEIVAVEQGAAARRRWPSLPWGPVTPP